MSHMILLSNIENGKKLKDSSCQRYVFIQWRGMVEFVSMGIQHTGIGPRKWRRVGERWRNFTARYTGIPFCCIRLRFCLTFLWFDDLVFTGVVVIVVGAAWIVVVTVIASTVIAGFLFYRWTGLTLLLLLRSFHFSKFCSTILKPYLNSSFGEVCFHGYLLPGVNVGVVGLRERLL